MGNRLYFHKEKVTRRLNGTSYISRKTATFDGRWSRTVYESNRKDPQKFAVARASLRKKGGDDLAVHRPHMMLVRNDDKFKPLSRLLSSGWYNEDRDIKYVGDEMIGDLQCHKLRLNRVVRGQWPGLFFYLWLTKDRNYLPVRREYYYPYWSEKLPWLVDIADDLREVAPGVWFPYHVSEFLHQHATRDGLCENRLIVRYRMDYKVQSLTLKPNSPADGFSKLVVPRGTKISVRDEQGKSVGSYKQEKTGNISPAHFK